MFVFFGVPIWNKGVFEGQKSKLQEKSSCHNFYCLLMDEIMLQTMHSKRNVLWMEGSQQNGLVYAVQLHFIQCPFPNQIQFGLEKLQPKIAYDFPNQFQFGLER